MSKTERLTKEQFDAFEDTCARVGGLASPDARHLIAEVRASWAERDEKQGRIDKVMALKECAADNAEDWNNGANARLADVRAILAPKPTPRYAAIDFAANFWRVRDEQTSNTFVEFWPPNAETRAKEYADWLNSERRS